VFLYLHGFASSPGSTKARLFRQHLLELGISTHTPALDRGDFEHLTLSSQRAIIDPIYQQCPAGEPVVIIGSSMGGYLAALTATRTPVAALVLLAPAVDFAARWRERLGPEKVAAWKASGYEETFHYGQQRNARISYALLEDAAQHEPWPRVSAPTLVLHGIKDDIVPQERVERWVRMNPSARLQLLDTDHEMSDSLETIWRESRAFLAQINEVTSFYPSLRDDK
jgi:hypothetical protein